MKAEDVTATLDLALESQAATARTVAHRPRLLSDNGHPTSPVIWLSWLETRAWTMSAAPLPSPDPRQDRALAPDPEEPHPARKLLPARSLESQAIGAFVELLQPPALPREPRKPDTRRRLLRQGRRPSLDRVDRYFAIEIMRRGLGVFGAEKLQAAVRKRATSVFIFSAERAVGLPIREKRLLPVCCLGGGARPLNVLGFIR
jgi:hypothetical protein